MIVHLEAFDRLTGTMELPDNWDYGNDLHLPFRGELPRVGFSGAKLGMQVVHARVAVFRYLGKCYATGKVYQLVEVR